MKFVKALKRLVIINGFCVVSFAQLTETETDFNYYSGLMEQAQEYNLKSVTVLYSKARGKKTREEYKATYNKDGNLISIVDHHYKRYKDYQTVRFDYDSLNRISSYSDHSSFLKKSNWVYRISYNEKGEVSALIREFYLEGNYASKKTLYSGRVENPRMDWRKWSVGDTVYTFYNDANEIIGRSKNKSDFNIDDRILDENGCTIGYDYQDRDRYRSRTLRDSLCRNVGFRMELLQDSVWVPNYQVMEIYGEDTIVSRRSYESNYKRGRKPEKIKLELEWTIYFEYYENGLLKSFEQRDEKDKLMNFNEYVYEFYDD